MTFADFTRAQTAITIAVVALTLSLVAAGLAYVVWDTVTTW